MVQIFRKFNDILSTIEIIRHETGWKDDHEICED
jgi:hypothetical protein